MVSLIPATLSTPAISTPRKNIVHTVTWGKAPKFDFEKGDFVLTGTGDLALANEIESLTQRIRHALTTIQFKWKIYETPTLGFFGSQLPTLIGKSYDEGVKINLAKTWAVEALTGDSRIINIVPDVAISGDQMYISLHLFLASGKELDIQQNWTIR